VLERHNELLTNELLQNLLYLGKMAGAIKNGQRARTFQWGYCIHAVLEAQHPNDNRCALYL
jgi:hypothetical protein